MYQSNFRLAKLIARHDMVKLENSRKDCGTLKSVTNQYAELLSN